MAARFRASLDGRVLDCDDAFARLLGFNGRRQLVGQELWPFLADAADRERLLERLQSEKVLVGFELRFMRKDGGAFWAQMSAAVLQAEAREPLMHAVVIDIAARRHGERALRQSEAKFRALLESAPDAIVIVDHAGRVALANQQTEDLFGFTRDELIGQPIETLVPQRFRQVHITHRAGYEKSPRRRPMGAGLDLYAVRKGGEEFPVEISLSPIQIGGESFVASAIRDVSERKQAESALRKLHQLQLAEAEHLATLGEVAAGLAHEIKNPLAGIAAALEVLAGELSPGHPSRDIMADVQYQVKRIKSTVDDLLNYARPRPLQLVRGDLNSTVEHVVHFAMQQAEAHGVGLVFVPGPLPLIVHDPDQIQQMVLNLLLNATEAVQCGGRVQISTAYTARDGTRQALIRVGDNGSGIAAEELEKIFRPFYTTKGRKGTGLGLSLCRRIAELHEGGIEVTSRVGEGSTFTVTLPDRAASGAAKEST